MDAAVYFHVFVLTYFGTSALVCYVCTQLCRDNPSWFRSLELDNRLEVLGGDKLVQNWRRVNQRLLKGILWNIGFAFVLCNYILPSSWFSINFCNENVDAIVCVIQSSLWIVYQLILATLLRFSWYWVVHQTFHRMHEWSITSSFFLVPTTPTSLTPTQQTVQKILHYWREAHSIHHGYCSSLPVASLYYHPLDMFVLHVLPILFVSRLLGMNMAISVLWFVANAVFQVLLHGGHRTGNQLLDKLIAKHDEHHKNPYVCRDVYCL